MCPPCDKTSQAIFGLPIIRNRQLTSRNRIGLLAKNVLTVPRRARDVAALGRSFHGAIKAKCEDMMRQSDKVSLLNAAIVGAAKLLLIIFAILGVIDYSVVGPLIGVDPAYVAPLLGAC